jgi:hypothetical protein
MSHASDAVKVTGPGFTPPVQVCPTARSTTCVPLTAMWTVGESDDPSSERVSTIFAWPDATAETIGCAGCDAQPAQQIAIKENSAPIPARIACKRISAATGPTNEYYSRPNVFD